MQNYQVGNIIEISTERMSFGLAAVGRISPNIVVFVKGAAPGETVRARIMKKHKNYYDAEIVKIIKPSAARVNPKCTVFGKCGGCQWQHLSYDEQVRSKKEILLYQIHKTTRMDLQTLERLTQIHAAQKEYGYRTRIQARAEKDRFGFYESGSKNLVDVDRCEVAHQLIQSRWNEFKKNELPELQKKFEMLKIEWSLTKEGTVLQALNREHAALGFTQINPEQNKVMQTLVHQLALTTASKKVLLDLYGGDGNLSHSLVGIFEKTFTVDAFNQGVPLDEINTKLEARILVRTRVAEFLRKKPWESFGYSTPDCILADPSRDGLQDDAKTISKIGASQIILVSCEPSKLSRDLMHFFKNHVIEKIHLIDMFPQTFHIEAIVQLRRNKA